jgi:hypothetical protein
MYLKLCSRISCKRKCNCVGQYCSIVTLLSLMLYSTLHPQLIASPTNIYNSHIKALPTQYTPRYNCMMKLDQRVGRNLATSTDKCSCVGHLFRTEAASYGHNIQKQQRRFAAPFSDELTMQKYRIYT